MRKIKRSGEATGTYRVIKCKRISRDVLTSDDKILFQKEHGRKAVYFYISAFFAVDIYGNNLSIRQNCNNLFKLFVY